MACTHQSETPIRREVQRLFGEISAKRGDLCENPVTGTEFVYGFDPIRLQKKMAYHALGAREDFARNGPADAPRLPLEHWECERVRWSGRPLDYLTAQYAKCVVALYKVKAHVSFDDYARRPMGTRQRPGKRASLYARTARGNEKAVPTAKA